MTAMLSFWGKTFSGGGASPPPFKPLFHHLIDVAAVARQFLTAQSARTSREAALLGMEPDACIRLLSFLAGLHDLGKFTRSFQAKVPDLWPMAALGSLPEPAPRGETHWIATKHLLEDQAGGLRARLLDFFPGLGPEGETQIVAAVAGHHGRPPDQGSARMPRRGGELCFEAAREAFDRLALLTRASPIPGMTGMAACAFSWRLSGLITLADWVGSDAEFFGPSRGEDPVDAYWDMAEDAARRALAAKGLSPRPVRASPALRALAPHVTTPRPMQALAEALSLATAPQLVLIEDTTGSGKTEAALLLAARLMAAGRGEGVYIALPTMATANAMHERLKPVVTALFATEETDRPSLILAHGGSALARALDGLKVNAPDETEDSVAAQCNAWIADDRRRAFFADVGAGTIDQCFLAVLGKKHLTLRQYALAGRILIIDEAHSFDAYMREEFATLLRLHAMNGGSAIVLSATLSSHARREMMKAFAAGLGAKVRRVDSAPEPALEMAYPLLTHVHASGLKQVPVDGETRAREIEIDRIADRAAATTAALDAANGGAAVLVICNAVDEAIGVFTGLATQTGAGRVHLFHARFAQVDRLTIEDDVLARFGRNATPERRSGHILVATQVVEQSLDLDFDLVISDLAPVDLLIQRAGRLWRHMDLRPAAGRALDRPRLLVVSPDPNAVTQADWLRACLGKAASVYDQPGIMWRSAMAVFTKGRLRTPDDLRPMIEEVYGHAIPLPGALSAADLAAQGKEGAKSSLGAYNAIRLQHGYAMVEMQGPGEDIGTRLGAPAIRVRLARRAEGKLVPWARQGNLPPHVAWALSEVKVRETFWNKATCPPEDDALHAATKQTWSTWDTGIALAEIEADDALRVSGGLRYASVYGLYRP